jgi:hypothetical protein
VSLRTVNGSIRDAKPVTPAGTSAVSRRHRRQRGSIGEVGNDLDIDCRAARRSRARRRLRRSRQRRLNPGLTNDGAATDDVSLEATENIYLTEVDAYPRLAWRMRSTATSASRSRVRDPDEDFYLVKSGSAQFAESNTRAPSGNDVDWCARCRGHGVRGGGL